MAKTRRSPPTHHPPLPCPANACPGSHGAFYYDDYGGGTPYKPAKVVIHPAYTGYDYGGDSEFDAAVVFLKECVKLGPRVATVPLATEEGGWGLGVGVERVRAQPRAAKRGGRTSGAGGAGRCRGED
jgi:hypothetical protein